MFRTNRTVILGYLIFLGLFFYASFVWLKNPLSVGGFAIIINVPIFTIVSIGFVNFAFRIWKIKSLQNFASGASLIAFLVFALFGLQVPKYSREFVEYKLIKNGYRTDEKFSSIFKENKAEFERVATEIRAKIGNHPCNDNTITEKQDIVLKQSFLGIPLRLHPNCNGREIMIPVMESHGLGEVNSWEIMYFLDWKQGLHLERLCGEGNSCTKISPGWIEFVAIS